MSLLIETFYTTKTAMQFLLSQIIPGIVVAFVSFCFGYFLFRLQRFEETKLEVFRRRLDSYEKIAAYLDRLDGFAHSGNFHLRSERSKYVQECFTLSNIIRIYIPKEVHDELMSLIDYIDFLPDSLWGLEQADGRLFTLMERDVGSRLANSRITMERNGKSFKTALGVEGNIDF